MDQASSTERDATDDEHKAGGIEQADSTRPLAPHSRQKWLKGLFLGTFYLLLALITTYPLVTDLAGQLLGYPDVDIWNHVWGFWWFKHMLLEKHAWPLTTELLGYPKVGRLYFIDPLNALLSVPLQTFLSLPLASNLVLLFELALAGVSAHLLAREAGARTGGALLAGTVVGLSPLLRCEVHNGITEVYNLGWLGLALWGTLRLLHSGKLRDGLLTGILGGLAFVACWYYGLAAGLAAGMVVLMTLLLPNRGQMSAWQQGRGRMLLALLLAGAAGMAIALPFMLAFRWTLTGPDAIIFRQPDHNFFLARHNAMDLLSFFMPGHYHHPDLWRDFNERFYHTTYLGWMGLVLAFIGLKAAWGRRFALLGALFGLLSLGPFLYVGGKFLSINNKVIPLPFSVLYQGFGMASITHSSRLATVTLFAVALGAALGWDRLQDWLTTRRQSHGKPSTGLLVGTWSVVWSLMVAELMFASPAPFPLSLSDARYAQSSYVLAQDPVPGAVLDVPAKYENTMRPSRFLYEQTLHQRPIPYLVDVKAGHTPGLHRTLFTSWMEKLFNNANDLARGRQSDILPMIEQENVEALRVSFDAVIRSQGFRYVVIHKDLLPNEDAANAWKLFFDRLLPPPQETDRQWIYRIDPIAESGSADGSMPSPSSPQAYDPQGGQNAQTQPQ